MEPALKLVTVEPEDEHYDVVLRLRKDIAEAARTLTPQEARYVVDLYYTVQGQRIATAGQIRAMSEEPHALLTFLLDQQATLEKQAARALDIWTRDHEPSQWARAQVGIGPVIAAGLRAHIDITKAPTVGHIWRFAGLDPTTKWEPKTKRPWNASLKVLCWKIGESFIKCHNRDGCFYGKVYEQRKAEEIERNEAGANAERAAIDAARVRKTTEAYKHYSIGKLPPGHINARARRYAVKLFLSHYHAVCYKHEFGKEPPLPYPIAQLGHAHMVPVPK